MATEILGHTLEEWSPMSPTKGPPLPEFLNQYWPWYKAGTPIEDVGILVISVFPSTAVIVVNGAILASGTYQGVTPGTYSWSASNSGYVTQSGTFVIVAGETTELPITLVSSTPSTGTFSFSVKGINLPSGAVGWACGFTDQTGNIYQRLGATSTSAVLSQDGESESFQGIPVSDLTTTVVIMAGVVSPVGAGVSINVLAVYTVNLTVQDGPIYTFDLSLGKFI